HLARELASMMGRDRRLASERITADHVDRALEHEPGRSVALPDVVHSFARLEMPWRAAGETLGGLDLAGVERRKHLVKAGLDDAHGQFSAITACPILAGPAGFGTTLRREDRAKGRAHSRRDDPWASGRATSDIFGPFRQWESH